MIEHSTNPVDNVRANGREHGLRRLWIILALLGLSLATIVSVGRKTMVSVPLVIAKETTYITAPLKDDGKLVDYFAAWERETYPPDIATDNNGFRLIVRRLGAARDSTPAHFAEICQKLGLDIKQIAADRRFGDPDDFLAAYVASGECDPRAIKGLAGLAPWIVNGFVGARKNSLEFQEVLDSLRSRAKRPWTLDDLPMMGTWLAENGPALDVINEAVRRPVYRIPLARENEQVALINVVRSDVRQQKAFARGLSARANYRIGTGNINGAIDDMVACKLLGRHVGSDGSLFEMLAAGSIEGIADSIGIAGSLQHPPTKGQLERLANEIDHLPQASGFEKALRFDRYTALEIMQSMFHGDASPAGLELPGRLTGVGLDWNLAMRRLNRYFDTVAAGGSPNYGPQAIFTRRARSETLADMLGAFLLPVLERGRSAIQCRECTERMRRISLAMMLYEADHGALPPAYTVDSGGNPLHSWRVLLLPYLGQQSLFDRVRPNEPWNSEHNRTLHNEAVVSYQCPSARLSPGQTTYSVVVGPEVAFEGSTPKRLADYGPKSAAMILVVECNSPVCWMAPAVDVAQKNLDMEVYESRMLVGGIGNSHPYGANFGLRNGAGVFLFDTVRLSDLLRGTSDEVP